ncbi:uncharacterized protein LOC107371419 [Tetranychus urticae]|uniref:PDZ domain-containing protein n=1 Tax=Tetranychus urticae TaxID=32264 RepID=T1JYC8_TETUR|nr:uncharacterized protein LOC107371419 [Tetranychus urticae]
MDLSHRPVKLCILSKWTPQYEGYGFDLMTKKSGEGHYISMVHEGGPAEATHLEAGDWLIEVNGVNVEKLNHGEVIKLIKESENGTVKLLLAPNETDKWRKRNQVTITSSHPDLVHYITPPYQGKLRSFLNGALDRLVIGKRGEQSDSEPSVYHRYSLPIPSGMSDNVVDWSPSGQSPNGRAEGIPMRQSAHGDGQFAGSLDEQRQKEIADWRDKSLEMLMASQIDQDEDDIDDHDIIDQVQDEVSILSPDVDDDDHAIYIDVKRGNNSRPISSNQEKVLADIHLIDNNSQQDNNSVITNNNNSDTNSAFQDNRHSTSLTLLDGEFFARQCKVRKDSETADYGFKMDSLPSGGGHFLRSIEPTGPAGISGICQNDRLIEVNNVNVEYTDHDTVVNMIRKSADCEVTLLVVDEKSYKWFQSRNIRIHHGAGGSLVRYCDHRGLREPGYTLDRSVSIEDNRRSQLYRRGLSQQSAGNSSDGDVEIKDQTDRLSKIEPEEKVNREDNEDDKEDDKEDVRQSTSTTGTVTTTRSSKINQRESRSTLSDWSFGSLSEADRFNRGKTIVRVPDDAPRPRLCSISKDPDGVFGFTLNTYEKGRVKLIADIDPGSPAEAAGLLQWDRVIEVNGVNINIENHAQVTGRIKASGNRLHLLVLPEGQHEWYEKAGIVPKSNQSNVIYLSNTDVTRDSITIARSLENSITNLSTSHKTKPNLPKKPSFSSSATTTMSNQLTSSMTSSTSESTLNDKSKSSSRLADDKDEHGDEEQSIVLKTDNQIKELNDQQIGDHSIRNSTISQYNTIQYNTIDEETSEAIYDHIETHQLSTLPLRKSKKSSFTKKIFKRSLFGGKKDKIYSTIGSMSNLSIKSDIVMGQSSSREQFNHTEAKITRSATLASEDDVPALPEDDENQVQLVVKKDLYEKSSVWSTSSDNIHNNNNNVMHNNNGITGGQDVTQDGQKDESESQLLEKLKTLSLREIAQKRAESKIQAYHRMQQLNFRQRIAHFEDL